MTLSRVGPQLPWLSVALLASCATTTGRGDRPTAPLDPVLQQVEVVFKQGKAYARQGDRDWLIAEVGRKDLLWAPEGSRFAYLKPQPERRKGQLVHHIVVRNIRGDSVNEFATYCPGRPTQLEWVDEQHISYLAPGGEVYVVHEVETAEIVQLHRGERFIWSPGRRHLAYVSGRRSQIVELDGQQIWPVRGRQTKRQIVGDLVWSPDGRSLTFLALIGRRAELVVLLELDDPDGHLTWPLPTAAASPTNRIFWGDSRVVVGESLLKPRYAASWTRIR